MSSAPVWEKHPKFCLLRMRDSHSSLRKSPDSDPGNYSGAIPHGIETPMRRSRVVLWNLSETAEKHSVPNEPVYLFKEEAILVIRFSSVPLNPARTFMRLAEFLHSLADELYAQQVVLDLSPLKLLTLGLSEEVLAYAGQLQANERRAFIILNRSAARMQPAVVRQMRTCLPHCFWYRQAGIADALCN